MWKTAESDHLGVLVWARGMGLATCWVFAVILVTTTLCAAEKPPSAPKPTHSGYLAIDSKPGSALYYAYWEAANKTARVDSNSPIVLWLQGGPGCASTFGAFYELGPIVTDEHGKLVENPFAWNRNVGLLIIDQPIGE
jgi:vitellogenic carboxypeptidase-like protein